MGIKLDTFFEELENGQRDEELVNKVRNVLTAEVSNIQKLDLPGVSADISNILKSAEALIVSYGHEKKEETYDHEKKEETVEELKGLMQKLNAVITRVVGVIELIQDKVEEEGKKPNKYIEAVDKADSEVWEKADAIIKNFTANEEKEEEATEAVKESAIKEALKDVVTGLLKECNVEEDDKLMSQVITGFLEHHPNRHEENVS